MNLLEKEAFATEGAVQFENQSPKHYRLCRREVLEHNISL